MSSPKRPRPSAAAWSVGPATASEAEAVLWQLPQEQGWNPGCEAWGAGGYLQVVQPGELVVSRDEKDGRVLSMIACPRFGAGGWIGLYIVREEAMRGKGLGMAVWRAAMEGPLKGCETIGLDGVAAQQGNYRKSGFVHSPWSVVRHTIKAEEAVPRACEGKAEGINVTRLGREDLDDCVAFDRTVFPDVDRGAFLRRWLSLDLAFAVVARDAKDKAVQGFGLVRPAISGYRIGPLYASSPAVARSVLHDLAKHVSEATPPRSKDGSRVLSLDVPEPRCAFATDLGFEAGFACMRMYWGKAMREVVDREFGICCWEVTF